MLPTTIRSPPAVGDFTPLSEHQEQTPDSFFDGKPVLYYQGTGAKAWLPKSQRGNLPFFPADLEAAPTGAEAASANGTTEELVEQTVDVFVNSQSFTVFCTATESGLEIPYPSITLHAIKNVGPADGGHRSVYLQLELSDGGDDDETFDTIELTIIPPLSDAASTSAEAAQQLFHAISECSNLNPDPVEEGDEEDDYGDRIVFEGDHEAVDGFTGVFRGAADGGLPPPLSSSGWITAENVHEFFDAEGNWIGGEEEEGISGELGEGAGRVRARAEVEEEEEALNGDGSEESKRPRTD